MIINLDGVVGQVTAQVWKAHGFLTMVVYDKAMVGRPYPSGYVTTYTIREKDLAKVLNSRNTNMQGLRIHAGMPNILSE